MRRLDPAALHGVAFDAVPPDQSEDEVGAAGGEVDQPFAALRPEMGDMSTGIHLGEVRDDEAGIPAGRAPGNDLGFEDDDGKPFLGGVQRGRKAGKAAADYRQVDIEVAVQRGRALRLRPTACQSETPCASCRPCVHDPELALARGRLRALAEASAVDGLSPNRPLGRTSRMTQSITPMTTICRAAARA